MFWQRSSVCCQIVVRVAKAWLAHQGSWMCVYKWAQVQCFKDRLGIQQGKTKSWCTKVPAALNTPSPVFFLRMSIVCQAEETQSSRYEMSSDYSGHGYTYTSNEPPGPLAVGQLSLISLWLLQAV